MDIAVLETGSQRLLDIYSSTWTAIRLTRRNCVPTCGDNLPFIFFSHKQCGVCFRVPLDKEKQSLLFKERDQFNPTMSIRIIYPTIEYT
jgi:hypothetical protein